MKFKALLFVLAILFASCMRQHIQDIIIPRDDLVLLIMDISASITGRKKQVNKDANITGETPCERNFSKAHKLFHILKEYLEEYPKIVKYPISDTTLQEIHQNLRGLQEGINTLPDGAEKTQFLKKCSQLYQYVSSLIARKDV